MCFANFSPGDLRRQSNLSFFDRNILRRRHRPHELSASNNFSHFDHLQHWSLFQRFVVSTTMPDNTVFILERIRCVNRWTCFLVQALIELLNTTSPSLFLSSIRWWLCDNLCQAGYLTRTIYHDIASSNACCIRVCKIIFTYYTTRILRSQWCQCA